MDNIVVADKVTSELAAREWGSFQLARPGVVQMPVPPSQVASVSRNGQDLIVTLKSGEQVTISNFFVTNAEGLQSDMVFVGEDGTLWQAQYTADAFNGFTFSEVASLDTLIAQAGVVGGATQTFAFAGLGLLGAGGAAAAASGIAGGGGGGGDGAAPALAAPTSLNLSGDGLTLSGTGTPGATINVRNNSGALLGSAVVGPDGNFSVPLDTPQNNGQPLIVDQTDGNGNTSPGTVITPADSTPPAAVDNLQLSADGLVLSGTGEAGSTVTVRDANGNILGSATVNAEGAFNVALGEAQLNGQNLTVEQTDATGNVSQPVTYNAADVTAPNAPANLAVSSNGLILSGTGEAGATVTVRDANENVLGTAIVGPNGTFSVTLSSAQLDGQTLNVDQADAAGNISAPALTTAPQSPGGPEAPDAPTGLQLSADGLTLTGTGVAGAMVTVRGIDGSVLGTAVAGPNGAFSIALSSAQLNGETLAVVQANAAGTSAAASYTAADITAPTAPDELLFNADGSQLSGRAEAGSTVNVRDANGNLLGSALAAADGRFTIVFNPALSNGQSLTVQAIDQAENTSPSASVTAPDIDGPVDTTPPALATDLAVSANGSVLTGRGEPGARVIVTNASGTILGTAVVAADGTFGVSLDPVPLNGETLGVTLTDAAGNVSDNASVSVPELSQPGAPFDLAVSADGLFLTGRAFPGLRIYVRSFTGALLGTAIAGADGTFSAALDPAQTDGEVLDVTALDAAGNSSASLLVMAPDLTVPDAVTALVVSPGGNSIAGKGQPGASVTVRDGNGNVLASAIVAANGTFVIALSPAVAEGMILRVSQTDDSGLASAEVTITVPDASGPVPPASVDINPAGTLVSGNGVAGTTVQVRDANGNVLGSTVVGADGTFQVPLNSPQTNGEILDVVVVAPNGAESIPTSINAADSTAPIGPVDLVFNPNGLVLSGRGEPGANVTVRDADGNVVGTAVVNAAGSFSVSFADAQNDGQSLQVTLSDAQGNTSQPAAVTAPDLLGQLQPANIQLDSTATVLTGTGRVGSTITVQGEDGTVLGVTTVGADGRFSVLLSTAQNNGQFLEVSAVSAAGQTSTPVSFQAADVTAPEQVSDLTITPDRTQLIGNGEPGAQVSVRDGNGNILGSAQVAADGRFTVSLSPPPSDGAALQVIQADAAGNISIPVGITAQDTTAPDQLDDLAISANGSVVSGTGEANARVLVLDAQGQQIGTGVVGANGRFEITLSTPQINGQTLTFTQTDAAGNISPAVTLDVPDILAPDAPGNLVLAANGLILTGSGEPGASVRVLDANGVQIGTTQVTANGTFSLNLASAQLNGEVLQVQQTDAAGHSSPVVSFPVADVTAPDPVANLQVSNNGTLLTGTGEAGSRVTVTGPGNLVLGSALVAADGSFSVTLSPAQITGQPLNVVQADVAGNASAGATATAPDLGAFAQPTGLAVDTSGFTLTGNAQPGTTVVVRSADGSTLGSALVSAGGSFSVTLNSAQLNGEVLNLVVSDGSGRTSVPLDYAVPDTTAPADVEDLLISPDGLIVSGSAEPGTTVSVTRNGIELGSATVDANGVFIVTLNSAAASGDLLNVVARDAVGNASTPVPLNGPDASAVAVPTNLLLSSDGTVLTGSAAPGSTVRVLGTGGQLLGTSAIVGADGTFSITLSPAQTDGQTLYAIASDAGGQDSVPGALNAADTTAPQVPGELVVNADGSFLSGRGEVGATVTVRGPDGSPLGTATVSSTGVFTVLLTPAVINGEALSVTQSDGTNTSVAAVINAPDLQAPLAATDLAINSTGTVVSGKGEAGTQVQIRDTNGTLVGSGTVDAGGNFQVNLLTPQLTGAPLQVQLIDAGNNLSPVASLASVDLTPPAAVAGLLLNASATILSGNGEPGATIEVRDASGALIGTASVDSNGLFSVPLSPAPVNGELIEVVQVDAAGNISPQVSLNGPDITAPAALTAVSINADGRTVTGSGEPGATVYVRAADGTVLGSTLVGVNGAFSVTLNSPQLNAQLLTVNQEDPPGNEGPAVNLSAPDLTAPVVPDQLVLNATGLQVTGRGEAGSTVTVNDASGRALGSTVVAANGTFLLTLSEPQLAGQSLSVSARDAAGNVSAAASLQAADLTPPAAVTALAVSASGATLTGLGEAGASVNVTSPTGTLLGTAIVAANGTFSVTLSPAVTPGIVLSVVQSDQAGNLSPASTVTAPGNLAPESPANLILSADGLNLSGTGTPDSVVTVHNLAGQLLGTAAVNADGSFNVLLGSAQLNGETLSISATSSQGYSALPVQLLAQDTTAPNALTDYRLSLNGVTVTGRGEAGATVTISSVNGADLATVLVGADGTFSVNLPSAQLNGERLNLTQTDAAGNESIAVALVAADRIAPLAATGLTLDSTGTQLSGFGEAGTRVTVSNAAGVELGSGIVRVDGSFQINLNAAQLNGQQLGVSLTDAAGNVSPVVLLSAADNTAPTGLTNLVIAGDGVSVTGHGEAGATVTVRNAQGDNLGSAVAGPGGTFTVLLNQPLTNGEALFLSQADNAGNVSPVSTLNAPDTTAPLALAGVTIDATGTLVSGNGEAGATVTVRNSAGTVLGTATVLADGNFSISLSPAQIDLQALRVQQADAAGNLSPITALTAPDLTPPGAVVNLLINTAGSEISGQAEPGAMVRVSLIDGTLIGSATVAPGGLFALPVTPALVNGEQLQVVVMDAAGNMSPVLDLAAPDITAPLPVANLLVNAQGNQLTGTGEAGANVEAFSGTVSLGTAMVAADGTFSIALSPAQLNGQLLSVVQSDAAGNDSTAATVTAPDTTAPALPDDFALINVGLTLTGTGEAGATIQVRSAGQAILGLGTVASDGTFSVTLSSAQLNGERLSIRQVDGAGNASADASFQVPDVTAPVAVSSLQLSADGLVLTGVGEAGASVVVRAGANVLHGGVITVAADGTFSVTLNAPQLNGQVLTVVQTDPAGNPSTAATYTAADITAPTLVSAIAVTSTSVTGSAEAGSTVTVRSVDGTALGSATVAGNGSFAVTLNPAQNTGAPLSVVASDAAGNASPALTINSVDTTPPGAVTNLAVSVGAGAVPSVISGLGEPGATVNVTIGGTNVGSGQVATNGTFLIELNASISGSTTLVVNQTDPFNNTSADASILITGAVGIEAPTGLTLSGDGAILSGLNATPGALITVRAPDGTFLGSAVVLPDNSFAVILNTPQTNGEVLSATASFTGLDSVPVYITAIDATPPAPLTGVTVSGGGTLVTGSGEPGATVVIRSADNTELGRSTVHTDGNFSVSLSSVQANGQVLSATQSDVAGNLSQPVQVTAPDTTAPLQASNLAVNASGLILTGNGESGAAVRVTDSSGNQLGLGTVASNGSFSVNLSAAQTNGQTLTVVLNDTALNSSLPVTITVPDTTPPAAPSSLAVVGSGLQLTGFGEPGATVFVSSALGVALGNTVVASDGSFTVLLAAAQLNGQVLSVVQRDPAGNTSPLGSVTAGDTVAPLQAINLTVNGAGTALSGNGEPGTRVEVRAADGSLLGSATVGVAGQFSVPLSPAQNDGQILTVRLVDAASNVSDPASVTAPDTTAPVAPTAATINAAGTLISGTGIAGDRVAVSDANGTRLGIATVAADGSWALILSPALIDSQVLSVIQLDAAGNASPAITATAPDLTAPAAVSGLQLSVNGLTLSGNAEAGSTVTVKSAAGVTLGTAVAGTNGSFSVSLNSAQINGETLTIGVADARGNQGPNVTLTVPDVDVNRPVDAFDNLATATVNLSAVTTSRTYTESFPSVIGLGFAHTFNFTVNSGTTSSPTLTLTTGGVLDLSINASFTLQVKNAAGNWITIGTAGNGSLINLQVLSNTGLRVDMGTLLAGEYRLLLASNNLSLVTTINSNLQLADTSLTQFNAVTGAAIAGNVISDPGPTGSVDITGPDNGAVLRILNGSSGYVSAGSGTVVQGLYGTLTIDAQGNYSYTAKNSASSVGKVDVFSYQLVHPNGLSDTATLYVRIDSPQASEVWSSTNLAAPALLVNATDDVASTAISLTNLTGSSTSTIGTVTAGLISLGASGQYNFTVSGANTLNDLTLTLTSNNLLGLLTSMNLTLYKQNASNPGQYDVVQTWTNINSLISLGGGVYGVRIDDQLPGNYRVGLSYTGVSVASSVTIGLINNYSFNNQFVVSSYTPVSGNLITDTAGGGADTLGSALTVLSVMTAANTFVQPGYNGTNLSGTYGNLLVRADGSYTYTLKSGLTSAVIGNSDEFTYQLTHPNGTTDTAKLTIDLNQASSARMVPASADSDDSSTNLALAASADVQTATEGHDILDGSHGGAVTLQGGAGDDTLIISDLNFASVDGGSGTDTLLWAGGDASIDLGSVQDRLSNIDIIDLNSTDNSIVHLTLGLSDLVAVSEAGTLQIKGSGQDSVHMTGDWNQDGKLLADGLEFTQYTPQEDPTHHLWVQNGIQVV